MAEKLRSLEILVEKFKQHIALEKDFKVQILTADQPMPRFSKVKKNHLIVSADSMRHLLSGVFHHESAEVHFWFLCQSLKAVFVEGLNIPEKFVSCVDRYILFPPRPPKYTLAESKNFVFAGRNVPGKNLDLLVEFFHSLQKSRFPGHKLFICGQGARGMCSPSKNVKYLGDLGPSWSDAVTLEKPAFISLSHYQFEDFSVAAAQAQSQGMPIVVPDWMGFCDLRGQEVYKLSPRIVTARNRQAVFSQWKEEMLPDSKIFSVPVERRVKKKDFCNMGVIADNLRSASPSLRRQLIDLSVVAREIDDRPQWNLLRKYIAPLFPEQTDKGTSVLSDLDFAYSRQKGLLGKSTRQKTVFVRSPIDNMTYKLSGVPRDIFITCGAMRARDIIWTLDPAALKSKKKINQYLAQFQELQSLGLICREP